MESQPSCECGTQTLDHAFECPAYTEYDQDKLYLTQIKEPKRALLREQVTSQHLRARAVASSASTNGHGGRPSITP